MSLPPHVRAEVQRILEDPVKNLKLDGHGPEQPVEERNNKGVGLPGFDPVKRGTKARAILQRCATGHIEFFNDLEELNPVVTAPCGDPVGLFYRTDERFAFSAFDSANSDKSDRCHCFNYRWCSRWVENTVGGTA